MNDDALRDEILTEFKQVHKLAPVDYTENCTNVVMSIIQEHDKALLDKVLAAMPVTIKPKLFTDGVWIDGHNYAIDACTAAVKSVLGN